MNLPKTIPIGWAVGILFSGMYLGRNEVRLAKAEDHGLSAKTEAAEVRAENAMLRVEMGEVKIIVAGMQKYLESNVPLIRMDTELTRKNVEGRSK